MPWWSQYGGQAMPFLNTDKEEVERPNQFWGGDGGRDFWQLYMLGLVTNRNTIEKKDKEDKPEELRPV